MVTVVPSNLLVTESQEREGGADLEKVKTYRNLMWLLNGEDVTNDSLEKL